MSRNGRKTPTDASETRPNTDEEPQEPYRVGYCKPPLETRFQKGKSGNPRGPGKRRGSFADDVEDVLSMKVTIKEDGRSRAIPTSRALLRVLRQKALSGNLAAIDRLLSLTAQFTPSALPSDIKSILQEDEALLKAFRARLIGKDDEDDGGG